ncbi:hypothetical protein SLA2020_137650 [Shorea laevis]
MFSSRQEGDTSRNKYAIFAEYPEGQCFQIFLSALPSDTIALRKVSSNISSSSSSLPKGDLRHWRFQLSLLIGFKLATVDSLSKVRLNSRGNSSFREELPSQISFQKLVFKPSPS